MSSNVFARLLLAAVAMLATLAFAAAACSATRLEFLQWERGLRATWSVLEFETGGGANLVRCPITMEATLHRRVFEKTSSLLLASVTRAIVENNGTEPPCVGGTVRIAGESLPWSLRYDAFSGVLPNISAIRLQLVGAMFSIHPNGGLLCTALTEAARPAKVWARLGLENGGVLLQINEIEAINEVTIPLAGEGGLCNFFSGRLRGKASATLLGLAEHMKIKLI
jgi:hypothetical protein